MYDLFLSSAGWGGADATRGGLYEFQLATILGDLGTVRNAAAGRRRRARISLYVKAEGDPGAARSRVPPLLRPPRHAYVVYRRSRCPSG